MDLNLDEILTTVRDLVTEQGRLVIDHWSEASSSKYKDRRDFATEVDVEVERNIKSALTSHFPDHGLSGEETGDEREESPYVWLIDPIDGTKYYAGHAGLFAVSVGLLRHGEPVLGVVYSAASRQCFYAREGGGAFLDGHRLSGPELRELSAVILNLDTPGTDRLTAPEREWFESRLVELSRRVYRIRALGIGSLAACWLATGALDAYVDLTGYAKPQDLAAGRVIMKEAGLRVGYIDPGVGPRRLVASSSGVWDALRDVLLT